MNEFFKKHKLSIIIIIVIIILVLILSLRHFRYNLASADEIIKVDNFNNCVVNDYIFTSSGKHLRKYKKTRLVKETKNGLHAECMKIVNNDLIILSKNRLYWFDTNSLRPIDSMVLPVKNIIWFDYTLSKKEWLIGTKNKIIVCNLQWQPIGLWILPKTFNCRGGAVINRGRVAVTDDKNIYTGDLISDKVGFKLKTEQQSCIETNTLSFYRGKFWGKRSSNEIGGCVIQN